MASNCPITPPLELLKYWEEQHFDEGENYDVMLIQAYQAGADQELDACCKWLRGNDPYEHDYHQMLRVARRPKPPSLKEQALSELDSLVNMGACNAKIIRQALEQLPE